MAPFSMCLYMAGSWRCRLNGIWLWGLCSLEVFLFSEHRGAKPWAERPGKALRSVRTFCAWVLAERWGGDIPKPPRSPVVWGCLNPQGQVRLTLPGAVFQAPGKMVTDWMKTNRSKDSERQGASLRKYDQMYLIQRKLVSSPQYYHLSEVRWAVLKEGSMGPGKWASKIKS